MNKTQENIIRVEAAMDTMRQAIIGARERLAEGLKLSRTQIQILIMLETQAQSTGELAAGLSLTSSAVTQTIETLVRRGLIKRDHDPDDRRIIHLYLTPEGREIAASLQQARRGYISSLVKRFSDAEIDALISITSKMAELINETRKSRAGDFYDSKLCSR